MYNPSLIVKFGNKFTQNDLESYIKNYFDLSIIESTKSILFDLEELEWISSEEITFLFAWIRKVNILKKQLTILLPFSESKFPNDDADVLERRIFIKYYMWNIWEMYKIGVKYSNFENTSDINNLINRYKASKIGKKVLPFKTISLGKSKGRKVDLRYKEIIKQDDGNDIFFLKRNLRDLLDENDCYTPFENKVISEIITRELVMNSMEHSGADECYFTTTLKSKWKGSSVNSDKFQDQFLKEKEPETLYFYRDKSKCKDIIANTVKTIDKNKLPDRKKADLNKIPAYNIFKNQAHLEFTFLDFGRGIHNTLKEQFDISIHHHKSEVTEYLSDDFDKQDEHSKIIEYAFLLESSKEPFGRDLEYNNLIPRGLYFLIDMIRRYKGLLVIRSGNGKLIYDFSDDILVLKGEEPFIERKYLSKEAIIHTVDNCFFDGTMVSIVIPEKKKDTFKKSGVRVDNLGLNKYVYNRENSETFPRKLFQTKEFHYLSLSFVFNVAETNVDYRIYNSKIGILSIVFSKIYEKLNELMHRNCVLFIDFECLPDRNNILRILLYLSNSPLVNELTKVIVLNLDETEFSYIKAYAKDVINENTAFLFKPIPCLNLNSNLAAIEIDNIKWIGIRNKNDEIILTNLFFGNLESSNISNIEDKWLAEGNIFSKFDDRVYSIFDNYTELISIANQKKRDEVLKWIKYIMNDMKKKYPDYYFLTSKGTYQKDYLTLYEPLHFKYTARYFAEYLLDSYIQNEITILEKHSSFNFSTPDTLEKIKKKREIKFDKILAVTVSSQLIAVEMRNIIREKTKYILLLNDSFFIRKYNLLRPNDNKINSDSLQLSHISIVCNSDNTNNSYNPDFENDCPELIKLASYLSFENEKPFSEIKERDKILIVNDVISTGSLIERLKIGIENQKGVVKSVLTIADTRNRNTTSDLEHECIFFDNLTNSEDINFENRIISLVSTEKDIDFQIKKLKNKPSYVTKVKRINPILNTIITSKEANSEKIKIIYEEPEKLINTETFSSEIFKIGHYKQNLSCNSYFTDMHKLFYAEKGRRLLTIIKKELEQKSSLFNITTTSQIKQNLHIISKNIENLIELLPNLRDNNNLKDTLSSIKAFINEKPNLPSVLQIPYSPDLIFHPVYSGIEEVTEDVFYDVFGTDKANVISMQRYETRNGWRFPFPSERLSLLAKNQKVLIIDSGALSGQSLVQLIDSISFLEVSRIDVITVIGRLDDFQREFYSKLRSIKVKMHESTNSEENNEAVINLNVLFGINLHIPSYHSEDVCPFCKELKNLELLKSNNNLPHETNEYIRFRKNEIKQRKSDDKLNISYIPKIKKLNLIDSKNIFLMRDRLGKVDSYRFYEEYFYFFDNNIYEKFDSIEDLFLSENKEDLKNIELILICILHEPNLIGLLKDLLRNVYLVCYELIERILTKNNSFDNLFYDWSHYSLFRLFVVFKDDALTFYSKDTFNSILIFIQNDVISINFLSYLISKELYKFETNQEKNNTPDIIALLEQLSDDLTTDRTNIQGRMINNFRVQYQPDPTLTVLKSFQNLHTFYVKKITQDNHGELTNLLSQVYYAITVHIDDTSYIDFLNDIKAIKKILNDDIYRYLLVIQKDKSIKKIYEKNYAILFESENNIYSELTNMFEIYDSIENENIDRKIKKIQQIAQLLDKFQNDFLTNLKADSFLTICKNQICCVYDVICKKLRTKVLPANLTIRHDKLSKDFSIDLQKEVFENFINEIFKNIISHSIKESNEKITLEISNQKRGADNILIFEQNTPFLNPMGVVGGTINIIQNILNIFLGNSNFSVDHDPNYKISITFKNIERNVKGY